MQQALVGGRELRLLQRRHPPESGLPLRHQLRGLVAARAEERELQLPRLRQLRAAEERWQAQSNKSSLARRSVGEWTVTLSISGRCPAIPSPFVPSVEACSTLDQWS